MAILRRAFAAIAVLVVFATAAHSAAAQVVVADLNGDGIRDRIEAARAGNELLVLTSQRRHAQRLRAHDSIVNVIVRDINRDGRADIIVSTRVSGLHVWINSGSGHFRSARPPRTPAPDWRPGQRAGDNPLSRATDESASTIGKVPLVHVRARAPTPAAQFHRFARTHRIASDRSATPRAPRGPPSSPLA